MASERIEEWPRRLSNRPGCYTMKNKGGIVLSAGKADVANGG